MTSKAFLKYFILREREYSLDIDKKADTYKQSTNVPG